METLPITYRDYTITAGEYTNFEFVSNNYDGPGDNRLGTSDTLDDCYTQIDEQIITSQEREIGILEKQIERLKKHIDEDAKVILQASIHHEEAKKDMAKLNEMLYNRQASIDILAGFVMDFMKTFEDRFESDENAFNYEQMDNYQRAASFMARKNGTARYLIRRVLVRMNEMAAGV